MTTVSACQIAQRLTRGQRQTVFGLEASDYFVLGCAEATAIRLTVDKPRRPALVMESPLKSRDGFRMFRLTPMGQAVKNYLTDIG
jgi:hypothetical protein